MSNLTGVGRDELLRIIAGKEQECEHLHKALLASEQRAAVAILNLTSTQARCTELVVQLIQELRAKK